MDLGGYGGGGIQDILGEGMDASLKMFKMSKERAWKNMKEPTEIHRNS